MSRKIEAEVVLNGVKVRGKGYFFNKRKLYVNRCESRCYAWQEGRIKTSVNKLRTSLQ